MQFIQQNPYGLLADKALYHSALLIRKLEEVLSGKINFDALITLSSTDFIAKNNNGTIKTVGMTYTNGACALPELEYTSTGYTLTIFKSALIHDEGGCANVHAAAHELGHLLGAKHDGTVNQKCNEENGLIMAPILTVNANSSDWSYCSIHDIENFLNSQQSECLFNRPKFGKRISRFLPGKITDVDTQCKYLGNLHATNKHENICVSLTCLNANGESYVYAGVSDGTSCGENKICLHKQCVDMDKITY
ncbi:A disintegrin and metalloproteinase with thrombospondin motifs 5-like [Chelonus insularis]|uniref:A disintegrin and metalloproteinase with thrombospondin motifs 5-like n=1 Tax=Chelonus insularis TaxID=460826 RepID=UPI001589EF45|nr:A disintegrin and metalloproteinase with thrombospondin motifs 5-like [Chelonus insularis]